ncbi:putative ribonuclease H-like domain-containing protein [Tanacetum coccineum]
MGLQGHIYRRKIKVLGFQSEPLNFVSVPSTNGILWDCQGGLAVYGVGLRDNDRVLFVRAGVEGNADGQSFDNANDQERIDSSTQDVNTVRPSINTASESINTGSSNINTASPIPNDPSMQSLEATGIFDDAYDDREVVGTEADLNNLETTMNMDVKSAFLYGTIEEEVYVCQPPSFEDLQFPDKVYKVEKALYGLHQALELKEDGIFISQDKYVADILKKFDLVIVKATSTPIETNKALNKDEETKDVDVYLYRLVIGSLMYLTAFRPDIMFVVCACARFQITPKVSHLHAVKRIFRYLKGVGRQLLYAHLIGRAATNDSSLEASRTIEISRRKQRKDSAPTEPTTEETTPKEHVSTPSYDPPPSGEDRMQLVELMSLCTNLQENVLDLEKAKTAQAKEITSLKKRVKQLEKRRKLRTLRIRRLRKVGSSSRVESSNDASLGAQEDASK